MGWSVAVAVSTIVALVVFIAVTVAVASPVAVGYIGFSGTIDTEIQWSAARKMSRNSIFVRRAPSCFDLHCNLVLPKLLLSEMWTKTILWCCGVCLRCCVQVLWKEPNPNSALRLSLRGRNDRQSEVIP